MEQSTVDTSKDHMTIYRNYLLRVFFPHFIKDVCGGGVIGCYGEERALPIDFSSSPEKRVSAFSIMDSNPFQNGLKRCVWV